MTRSVVLDGHTLGVVFSNGRFEATGKPRYQLQILKASVLRGSPISGDPLSAMGTLEIDLQTSNYREATEQDFDEFGVVCHPDYLKPLETPA